MPISIPAHSVGLVQPQTLHVDQPLALASGRQLQQYDLIYETYGSLNSQRSNAILICHALSGERTLGHRLDEGGGAETSILEGSREAVRRSAEGAWRWEEK